MRGEHLLDHEDDVGNGGQEYGADEEEVLSRRRALPALIRPASGVVDFTLSTEDSSVARRTPSLWSVVLVIGRAETRIGVEAANEVGGVGRRPPIWVVVQFWLPRSSTPL